MIRHGESVWNKENVFTGWIDVPLSEEGIEQAKKAGQLLKKEGFVFDIAFTSPLQRAIKTLDIVLEKMGLIIPVKSSWRLNERHYGALQGMNKDEMRKKYGTEMVEEWRRSYDIRPPAETEEKEFEYKEFKIEGTPLTESLKDTEARVLPYWNEEIIPAIKQGKRLVISAHGNSIRAIVKIIDNISDEKIAEVEIPVGVPLIYETDDNFNFVKKYYLDKNMPCDF